MVKLEMVRVGQKKVFDGLFMGVEEEWTLLGPALCNAQWYFAFVLLKSIHETQ
jgi:hypothetical protein